jgi:hypothetical protein
VPGSNALKGPQFSRLSAVAFATRVGFATGALQALQDRGNLIGCVSTHAAMLFAKAVIGKQFA